MRVLRCDCRLGGAAKLSHALVIGRSRLGRLRLSSRCGGCSHRHLRMRPRSGRAADRASRQHLVYDGAGISRTRRSRLGVGPDRAPDGLLPHRPAARCARLVDRCPADGRHNLPGRHSLRRADHLGPEALSCPPPATGTRQMLRNLFIYTSRSGQICAVSQWQVRRSWFARDSRFCRGPPIV